MKSENVPKKRNRWGSAQDLEVDSNSQADISVTLKQSLTGSAPPSEEKEEKLSEVDIETSKLKRKSRWSNEPVVTAPIIPIPLLPVNPLLGAVPNIAPVVENVLSQETMQQIMILKIQLNQINESLLTVVQDAKAMEQNPNRSPSPPPKYDSSGKRTNLREVRMRDTLLEKRSKIIEEMMKLNPTFPTPMDFLKTKPIRRIYLPKQTNPLYNPIGLIIGPRGNTQKQLEQETGCKISVRGKGSAKEGSKGRATKVVDEDEELHVHIIGDTEEMVERAAKLIEDILKPDDENLNVYKQKQLRELALINGTLREDGTPIYHYHFHSFTFPSFYTLYMHGCIYVEYCPICGEKGHKQFECPHRAKAFKAAAVKCAICGDLSHPTRDCPLKNEGPTNEVALDNEYDSFLAELGEGPGPGSGAKASSSSSAGSEAAGTLPGGGGGGGVVSRSGGQTFMRPIVDLFAPMAPQQQRLPVVTPAEGNSAAPPMQQQQQHPYQQPVSVPAPPHVYPPYQAMPLGAAPVPYPPVPMPMQPPPPPLPAANNGFYYMYPPSG